MKRKRIGTPISRCRDCYLAGASCCWHPDFEEGVDIPDKSSIPDWCPLPDYKEKEEQK